MAIVVAGKACRAPLGSGGFVHDCASSRHVSQIPSTLAPSLQSHVFEARIEMSVVFDVPAVLRITTNTAIKSAHTMARATKCRVGGTLSGLFFDGSMRACAFDVYRCEVMTIHQDEADADPKWSGPSRRTPNESASNPTDPVRTP
jgi:hypothetical protein